MEEERGYTFRVIEISKPVGKVSCHGVKDPAVFLISNDRIIGEIEEEAYRLIQLGKQDIRLLVSWDFRTIKEPRYNPPGEEEEDQLGTQPTPSTSSRKRAYTKEDATKRQRRQVEFTAAIETATGSFASQITGKW